MTSKQQAPIPPGSTIGIMGGGQLGRMTALAAAELGYQCIIFTDVPDSPASQVCKATIVAAYNDPTALKTFADSVDVVTFEFENIPLDCVEWLTDYCLVRPNPRALAIAQDRAREKSFLNRNGISTAPWVEITNPDQAVDALETVGCPAVFKTARLGYDGKGQATVHDPQSLRKAWQEAGEVRGVLEGFIDFDCEISAIAARAPDGTTKSFDVVENQHANHILNLTIAPARIDRDIALGAMQIGENVAAALDLVGLIAVELFVTTDGELLANEFAPRPHNSGHWTADACITSQFEQFARAVCGLPLGSPMRHSNAIMQNLIGSNADYWSAIVTNAENNLHLYGKKETRPNRKMGHVTRLYPLSTDWTTTEISSAITKSFWTDG